jgi:hypothetical protein
LTASAEPTAADINAPVPQVRPAFKDAEAAGMAVALLPPSRNAASDAIQAALPAEQEISSEFADLSQFKIPVPSLLGPRPMNGDAQADIQTASANIDGMGGECGAVPLPANRPAVAEALVASTDGAGEVDGDEAEAALSPSVMAALAQNGSAIRAQLNAGEASAGAEATAAQPVQVAALEQPRNGARTVDFGDVFDQPQKAGEGVAAGTPAKGARPKKIDAEAATRDAVRGEPKLTQQIISQWALSQARMETMSKAVKAPRFVSHTLRTQPTQVYAAGFARNGGAVDPARFSGAAVNFMEVRKFDNSD